MVVINNMVVNYPIMTVHKHLSHMHILHILMNEQMDEKWTDIRFIPSKMSDTF